jgi:chromosome partitioning protein
LPDFCRDDATTSLHRGVTGDVAHQFGASRLLPAIRSDIRAAEAFAAGKPIRYFAPKSRAAEDFAQLGKILAQLCR